MVLATRHVSTVLGLALRIVLAGFAEAFGLRGRICPAGRRLFSSGRWILSMGRLWVCPLWRWRVRSARRRCIGSVYTMPIAGSAHAVPTVQSPKTAVCVAGAGLTNTLRASSGDAIKGCGAGQAVAVRIIRLPLTRRGRRTSGHLLFANDHWECFPTCVCNQRGLRWRVGRDNWSDRFDMGRFVLRTRLYTEKANHVPVQEERRRNWSRFQWHTFG
jgi:hypothetical protein